MSETLDLLGRSATAEILKRKGSSIPYYRLIGKLVPVVVGERYYYQRSDVLKLKMELDREAARRHERARARAGRVGR